MALSRWPSQCLRVEWAGAGYWVGMPPLARQPLVLRLLIRGRSRRESNAVNPLSIARYCSVPAGQCPSEIEKPIHTPKSKFQPASFTQQGWSIYSGNVQLWSIVQHRSMKTVHIYWQTDSPHPSCSGDRQCPPWTCTICTLHRMTPHSTETASLPAKKIFFSKHTISFHFSTATFALQRFLKQNEIATITISQ